MDLNDVRNERLQNLNYLKCFLKKIDDKLRTVVEDLGWNYDKLLQENPNNMVICSVNKHHRVPRHHLKTHEEKCCQNEEGYLDADKPFSEHSGSGSFITITPELLSLITNTNGSESVFLNLMYFLKLLGFKTNRNVKSRLVPKTSNNLDQNFNREEKLAIYDYVVANTKKQQSFSDLFLQPLEKKEDKKEMTSWEIAAAERDAKRRRASYRNKVHTNRKTHTEILREVIEVQMEILKDESSHKMESSTQFQEKHIDKRHKHESSHSDEKRRHHKSSDRRDREEKYKSSSHKRHSKNKDRVYKTYFSSAENDSYPKSRSHEKYRKWKAYEGRSHSHKSNHSYRKNH